MVLSGKDKDLSLLPFAQAPFPSLILLLETYSLWVISAIQTHPGLLPTFNNPSFHTPTTLLDSISLFPSSLCIPYLLLSQMQGNAMTGKRTKELEAWV